MHSALDMVDSKYIFWLKLVLPRIKLIKRMFFTPGEMKLKPNIKERI